MVEVAGRTQSHSVNGNSSDFTNGGATIALTLDSAIADEAQVRVSYAAQRCDGCIGCDGVAGGI